MFKKRYVNVRMKDVGDKSMVYRAERLALMGLLVILTMGLLGCQPLTPVQTTSEGEGEVVTLPAAENTERMEINIPAGAEELVTLSTQDLAQELGVESSQIVVTAIEPVDWPDASLGCPQPGMMYAQVITTGYRMTLEVDGQSHEYHTGGKGSTHFIRCENQEK